jgi:hypothetical protein
MVTVLTLMKNLHDGRHPGTSSKEAPAPSEVSRS